MTTIRKLIITKKNIGLLNNLPDDLRVLEIIKKGIKTLPNPLPSGLKKLIVPHNELEELPELPPMLETLVVTGNKLKTLPVLPSTLLYLSAENNELTTVPNLPDTLMIISLMNNKIVSLPCTFPECAILVSLENNPLTELPLLNSNLKFLQIDIRMVGNLSHNRFMTCNNFLQIGDLMSCDDDAQHKTVTLNWV